MKKLLLSATMCVIAAASFAQGMYIEYKITAAQNSGTVILSHQDGNTRSEMNISIPQMPGGGIKRASLILKAEPGKAYQLNEQNKTYTESDIDQSDLKESKATDYEVTVIGKEKVNNYNATHVQVKRINSTIVEDMWLSTEVVNYARYKSVRSKYTSDGLYKAMIAKGADGIIVRIKTGENGRDIQLDLVKAETKAIDASLFSLSGYTKAAAPAAHPTGSPSGSDMYQKIQNMTPEERTKYLEEIKKQYGAH